MTTLTTVTPATTIDEQIAAIVKTHRDDLITDLRNGVDPDLILRQYNYFALVGDLGDRFPSLTRDELHASATKAIDAAKRAHTPQPKPKPVPAEISTELLQQAQYVAVRYARRKMRDAAEDIAQDAVIQVWRSYSSFDPARSSFNGWVRMITRTHCHKHRLSGKTEHLYREHLESVDVAMSGGSDTNIADRLPELTDVDQTIVESVMAGHSVTETSGRLGLTRKAVRYRLDRLGKK